MAFRGRRSTACRLCRERRIKCDRHHPGCTQCRNVGAVCEGYPNPVDLMFQHETDMVIQKARSRAMKQPPTTLVAHSAANQTPVRSSISVLPRQPTLSPSLQAIGLFTSAYAGGVYLEYLPVLCSRQGPTPSLDKSLEAVALSYMANEQRRGDLRQLARRSYGMALSQLSLALQAPTAATLTETMASILLLALFEAISPSSQNAQDTWSRHVQGALAAILSCSSIAFQTPIGQSLLHHIISVVQLDCIYRRVPLPPQLQPLYRASMYKEGPQVEMWSVLDRLASLNAWPLERPISLHYISQLQEMETDIQRLLVSMPEVYRGSFAFLQASSKDNGFTCLPEFSIPSHKFQNFRIAQAWNTLRLMCLLTTKLLTSGVALYLSRHSLSRNEATRLLESSQRASLIAKQTTIDICASVPDDLRPDGNRCDPDTTTKYAAWARSLIWPLSMAKDSPHESADLQNYIEKQLGILGPMAGMHDVHWQTQHDETSQPDWLHVIFLC